MYYAQEKEYYAIEIIGYGKRRCYAVKKVDGDWVYPTDGKAYRTEELARNAAAKMGVKIEKVGDIWQISHLKRSWEQ